MSNDISKDVLPTYLQNYEGPTGTEDLQQYIRLPFLRVVQGIGPLADEFEPGTIILMPRKEVLFDKKTPFHFTPLYHYKEWGIWYDIKANMANPLKDRTVDPDSDLAKIAMGRDRDAKTIVDPDHKDDKGNQLTLEYRESLVYIIFIHEKSLVAAITFNKGEHSHGRMLGEKIALRKDEKGDTLPIFSGTYSAISGVHKSRDGKWTWKGFDIDNAGWVSQEDFDRFKKMFLEFVEKRESIIIEQDNDDLPEDKHGGVSAETNF